MQTRIRTMLMILLALAVLRCLNPSAALADDFPLKIKKNGMKSECENCKTQKVTKLQDNVVIGSKDGEPWCIAFKDKHSPFRNTKGKPKLVICGMQGEAVTE